MFKFRLTKDVYRKGTDPSQKIPEDPTSAGAFGVEFNLYKDTGNVDGYGKPIYQKGIDGVI